MFHQNSMTSTCNACVSNVNIQNQNRIQKLIILNINKWLIRPLPVSRLGPRTPCVGLDFMELMMGCMYATFPSFYTTLNHFTLVYSNLVSLECDHNHHYLSVYLSGKLKP